MNKRRRFKAHRRRKLERERFRCVTGAHTPYLPGLDVPIFGYILCRHCRGSRRFTVTGPEEPWLFTVRFEFSSDTRPELTGLNPDFMIVDELDDWRCADCGRPLIDCPGQAKNLTDGKVICEPCSFRRDVSAVLQRP